MSGFKGFTARGQGVGRFGAIDGTCEGLSGSSDMLGEDDSCGGVLTSEGFSSESVPSLSMRQLWSCVGLFVSRRFPPASLHS